MKKESSFTASERDMTESYWPSIRFCWDIVESTRLSMVFAAFKGKVVMSSGTQSVWTMTTKAVYSAACLDSCSARMGSIYTSRNQWGDFKRGLNRTKWYIWHWRHTERLWHPLVLLGVCEYQVRLFSGTSTEAKNVSKVSTAHKLVEWISKFTSVTFSQVTRCVILRLCSVL